MESQPVDAATTPQLPIATESSSLSRFRSKITDTVLQTHYLAYNNLLDLLWLGHGKARVDEGWSGVAPGLRLVAGDLRPTCNRRAPSQITLRPPCKQIAPAELASGPRFCRLSQAGRNSAGCSHSLSALARTSLNKRKNRPLARILYAASKETCRRIAPALQECSRTRLALQTPTCQLAAWRIVFGRTLLADVCMFIGSLLRPCNVTCVLALSHCRSPRCLQARRKQTRHKRCKASRREKARHIAEGESKSIQYR